MSTVFLGILVPSRLPAVKEFLSSDQLNNSLGVARFADEEVFVFAKRPRGSPAIGDDEIDRLARNLSSRFASALFVDYDSRLGYRASEYFENGNSCAKFGPDDELWVPLLEDGELNRGSPPLSAAELRDDEEYGTIKNAIDFGFEVFGHGSWSSLGSFLAEIHRYE